MRQRIVDLTRTIEPTGPDARRKFVIHKHDALLEIPGKVRPEGEWYIMSDVELMDHVGTHIEVPLHCLKQGADLAQVPVEQLVGEAVILDLTGAEAEGGVTLEQVQAAAEDAGGIQEGDILLEENSVSSIHACITRKEDGYYLEDLDSTNGTFIRIKGERKLEDGDEILIGLVRLRLEVSTRST